MNNQLGFIVRGGPEQPRRLCDWGKAFAACAEGATAAATGTEGYLSMFTYPPEMTAHMEAHGSPKGYAGATGGAYVWLDFDGAGALDDTRRLCLFLEGLGGALGALVFYSGGKGYHLGIPTAAIGARPGPCFHTTARAFVETLARDAGAAGTLDTGIYDRVRIFRAPNSRHPRSGLHKVALDFESMHRISENAIKDMALHPFAFDIPDVGGVLPELARRWTVASDTAAALTSRRSEYKQAAASGGARLSAGTLAFIREGGPGGERARRLFMAAANLAEFDATPALVLALLEEAALDSGLTPSEVRRQIECGIAHGGRAHV